MGLKHSYSLLAPFYDLVVAKASQSLRASSLEHLHSITKPEDNILIAGIGTGLDIPFLGTQRNYYGIDLTPAMLSRAKKRVQDVSVNFQVGDVMNLPYKNESFDAVVMHLIMAVVSNPTAALQESQRVLKTDGHLIILDKFLKPGQLAPVRRLFNPLIRQIATQTNITFEHHIAQCPQLAVVSDEPVLAGGWFRRIHLTKKTSKNS